MERTILSKVLRKIWISNIFKSSTIKITMIKTEATGRAALTGNPADVYIRNQTEDGVKLVSLGKTSCAIYAVIPLQCRVTDPNKQAVTTLGCYMRQSQDYLFAVIQQMNERLGLPKELQEFGLTVGIILVILGAIALWRQKSLYPYFLGFGIIFIAAGLFIPNTLRPFQKVWMAFSIILGFFVSRIILTVLFYFVLTPLGLTARIFGKDILNQRIDKSCKSYWHDKGTEVKNKESYENQY